MFAATSLNGVTGHAALLIGLASCVFGAIGTAIATRRGDVRLLRSVGSYAWVAFAGAALAVVVMVRALIVRDFDLAYIQQVGSYDTPVLYNVTALWECPRGQHPVVAVHRRRLHGHDLPPVSPPTRRPARRLGAGRDVRRHGVLLFPGLRPNRRVQGRRSA
jgi:hypothetical protein